MRGGVSDHTLHLAGYLAREFKVSVLTSQGIAVAPDDRIQVHARIKDWHDIDEFFTILESLDPVESVIWQYVPHMYGRGGVNLQLHKALRGLAKLRRQQLIIAHEIAAPLSLWPHRLWYSLAQRWQWRRLIEAVDLIGISTEAWCDLWAKRVPDHGNKIQLLPSPATIPLVSQEEDYPRLWRQQHGLTANTRILAFFGTLSAAKQFSLVVRAWEQAQANGAPVALVVIGDRPEIPVPAGLEALFKPLGHLSEREVSEALQAADVLALPFIDGVSERRTSFMAGLSHGCAVVTTFGSNTGHTLRGANFFAATEASDHRGFVNQLLRYLNDPPARKYLGEAGRLAYKNEYSWPRLVERIKATFLGSSE